MSFWCTCRAGCLDNVVLCSSVDVLRGWLYSFSFGCLNVGVYLSGSQGFSLICSLSRARLCWGGSVAIEGSVLYAGRDYGLHLNIMLLVQVWAYVMSDMFAHG